MATTGAVIYLRPTFADTVSANRQSGAVLYVPFRGVSGIYSAGGAVETEANAISKKSMLPPQRARLVDQDGYITPEWWRFFNWLLNEKLGGMAAPSVTDLTNSISSTQEAVTTSVASVASLTETVVQNADVLDTVKQVAVNNSLSGSASIGTISRVPQLIA
jgi:hypothetical protein